MVWKPHSKVISSWGSKSHELIWNTGLYIIHVVSYAVLSKSEITAFSRNPEYPQTLSLGNIFPM